MKGFNQESKTWFQWYQMAQQFTVVAKDDRLMSLPYIREAIPFEYQIKTVKAVIHRFKGRALLCDEVGLGKTVEEEIAAPKLGSLWMGLITNISFY
ncbi:hypothetical protein JOD43_000047 [Pullulanibacillus pueri]|uniref:SNF2 N-terminal domain-containing protein n=1 Tax=Pullulanibacillus pueri TaxID=1437324 RepID=A0A8J2ZRR8_9BACL|nr:hypothetical protein [Pullulanibacillus pueri]MBM7679888.1 hypothetical protein [Pullulanibacillus pueri]GGH73331.1 hypothetical protein GCM10007096_00460 [Pullulanibacillus pueri]